MICNRYLALHWVGHLQVVGIGIQVDVSSQLSLDTSIGKSPDDEKQHSQCTVNV